MVELRPLWWYGDHPDRTDWICPSLFLGPSSIWPMDFELSLISLCLVSFHFDCILLSESVQLCFVCNFLYFVLFFFSFSIRFSFFLSQFSNTLCVSLQCFNHGVFSISISNWIYFVFVSVSVLSISISVLFLC